MATDQNHQQRRYFYHQQQPPQQQQPELEKQEEQRLLTPEVWQACAGSTVQIPAVNSIVYYFPQGHLDQAISTVDPSPAVASRPLILCRVLQVQFLADRDTDEVFAKILLEPLRKASPPEPAADGAGEKKDPKVRSFAKVLTPSDANNGGGFSVPRYCADSVFPPLNFKVEPPVQNIEISDLHGTVWSFRHIYRGTPRRHLLTTGWSKFVNSKKLIAGDSVVFVRDLASDKVTVGIRRALKPNDCAKWLAQFVGNTSPPVAVPIPGGFSRNEKGRVPVEVVAEAAERAANNLPFEVFFYPRAGLQEFIVPVEKVEKAMNIYWASGTRVKMAMETEDSSRMAWFQGTVSRLVVTETGNWRGTIWQMLEVAWDEPELLKNMKRVNPWQVEVTGSAPPMHTVYPATKRFRPTMMGLLTDGEGNIPLPNIGFSSLMGQLNPSYMNYNTFPAGMQGARQNFFFGSSSPNIMNDVAHQMCPDNHLKNSPQKVAVCTNLNIGSSSSEPSADSQNSEQLSETDIAGQQSINSSRKSIQLFGKIIHMEQPADDVEYDCSAEGKTDTQELSLSTACMNLADRLGAQCQRSSIVEAFVTG